MANLQTNPSTALADSTAWHADSGVNAAKVETAWGNLEKGRKCAPRNEGAVKRREEKAKGQRNVSVQREADNTN